MTDREMLKLAAKAIGEKIVGELDGWALLEGVQEGWNPLTDDGDALRLAVTLRMYLMHLGAADVGARCPQSAPMVEDYNGDPCAATRRAIVRAAAELGSRSNVGGEARLAAHQPLHTTTATPQGVASTDQLGGRFRSERN